MRPIAKWLHGALDQEPKAIAALSGSGIFLAVPKQVVKFVTFKTFPGLGAATAIGQCRFNPDRFKGRL